MISPKALLGITLLTPLFIALLAPSRAATAQPAPQPVAQPAPQTRFLDTQNHWAASCITAMDSWGFMQGYPNGSFQPGGTMTRAEFAAMIVKAYPAADIQSAPNFTDVPTGFWAKRVIQQAYTRGFLVGYPNRQFRPNQTISRAQALTILAKAQQLSMPLDSDRTNDILMRSFDDQAAIPDYARDAIAAATKAKLVVNYPNMRVLRPQAAIARGEVAALLCQAHSENLPTQFQVPPQYIAGFNPEDNNIWQQATLLKTFSSFSIYSQIDPLENVTIFQNNLFFFIESKDSQNQELWVTDGTTAGTQLLKGPVSQNDSSTIGRNMPKFIGTSAQRVWFSVENSSQRNQFINSLWSSDGTTAGTTQISFAQALNPYSSWLNVQPNIFLNDSFVFSLINPTETQLWQSNGQSSQRLDLFPNPQRLRAESLVITGQQLFFTRQDKQDNTQLWRSNGTDEIALQTFDRIAEPLIPWQNRVYIKATRGTVSELWASDGTPSGTALLKDNSNPRLLTGLGSTFFALDNSPQGTELWATQGTPASTSLVKRLSPFGLSSGAERVFFVHQGRLFFSFVSPIDPATAASDVKESDELWVTDGTASGTQQLAKFPNGNVENFTVFKDRLFFSGGGSGGQELWSTDGTVAGTRQVVDLAPGQTILPAPCAPPNQRSGPCPPATVQEHSSVPKDLTPYGDWLYFLTNEGALYRTNGTAQGTDRIKQFENSEGWRPNSNSILKVNQRLVIITKLPPPRYTEGLTVSDSIQIWSLE